MGSLVTAVTLSGVLDYYYVGTQIIKAPEEMVEKQIFNDLTDHSFSGRIFWC